MTNSNKQRAEQFKEFHLTNPQVYEHLTILAKQLRAHSEIKNWGIRNLWEKLRWDLATDLDVQPLKGDFRLNNNYAPFYSRLLVRDYPHLFAGWLELRGDNCQLPDGI